MIKQKLGDLSEVPSDSILREPAESDMKVTSLGQMYTGKGNPC